MPRALLRKLAFRREYAAFARHARQFAPRFALRWEDRWPCLNDRTAETEFDRHYVYHPAWAARILAATRPSQHTDIASSVNFCSMVSAFVPTRFYDYRPAALELDELTTGSADLTSLPFGDESVESLSCMHVVEHVGLGRYGDRTDYDGDLKAMAELRRTLARGGQLLFVVPIGSPRICFNAHRVYAYRQVAEAFGDLTLREFALVPDSPETGHLIRHASESLADIQRYGCGCFWFTKP